MGRTAKPTEVNKLPSLPLLWLWVMMKIWVKCKANKNQFCLKSQQSLSLQPVLPFSHKQVPLSRTPLLCTALVVNTERIKNTIKLINAEQTSYRTAA